MKRSVLKKSIPLTTVLLAAMLVVGGTAAYFWMSSREISSSLTILATYGVGIWDTDGTTALISITFGEQYRGYTGTYPTDPDVYYIENTGEDDIYIYYSKSLPTGVILYLQWSSDSGSTWNEVNNGWLSGTGTEYAISAGETIEFRLWLSVNAGAEFGVHSPVITIAAYDVPDLIAP